MPHRQARKAHADISAHPADEEAGFALVVIGANHGNLVRQFGDFVQKFLHFTRFRAVIQRNYQLDRRSEEHTSELQSLMRISYAVFCLKKKKTSAQTKLSE